MGKIHDDQPKGIFPSTEQSRTKSQQMEARMLKTIPWTNCPPHSPEETYKRQASIQYDSIHFCNGCSVRDTRPQNLNYSCIQQKFTLLTQSILFHK
jgi:hypothetical protein